CMHSRRPPGMFLWQACQCGCVPPCTGRSPVSWAKSVGFKSRPLALSAPSALPILVHSLVHNIPSTRLGTWMCVDVSVHRLGRREAPVVSDGTDVRLGHPCDEFEAS